MLRQWFERWGRPARIRVDNGAPWGNHTDTPPALSLWWAGLGIEPVWNHPYSPTENPFVERCNGLVDSWGEPSQCANLAEFAARLEWVATTQRERYPAVQGCTRLQAHPELEQNPRRSTPAAAAPFEVQRVWDYLAQGRWPRWVSKGGQITMYGKPYQVRGGRAGERVWVRLDAETVEWVVQAEDGRELVRKPAQQLTAERILALNVAQPHRSGKRKRQNSPSPAAAQLCGA